MKNLGSKFFCLIMLVLSSIYTSCNNTEKQKIRIYVPIVESNIDIAMELFLYIENDSTFCYCYDASTSDVIKYSSLTYGKVEKIGNLRVFYDELGRRIFTAILRDEILLIKSGLFKGIKLIEVDTADYIEAAKIVLHDMDNKEPIASTENIISYFTKNNHVNKNIKFRRNSSINLCLNLEDDGSFNLYFDSNLLIRSGHYVANNGIYTFYDTIIPTVEKVVAVFDSSIYSINFGFMNSIYIQLGNNDDIRRADTMRYKLGLINEYPIHHSLPKENFIIKEY